MADLLMHCDQLTVELKTGVSIQDITRQLESSVVEAQVINGVVHATVVGSTGSITTIEYESGVVEDLSRAINELAPPGRNYAHEEAWHDGNGHSHVQAALLGPSISLAVRNGRLALGTWQQVVLINHDNRPRTRKVEVTLIGQHENV
ncbi:MAG: secondary thiamine-phosphate synthase enzyme YjbQ [Desulfobulbaceae bacterium]|nr:secondary thiamine-phosphate synthase enzyme YjbQ [Desulfobulbaceae bacterium]